MTSLTLGLGFLGRAWSRLKAIPLLPHCSRKPSALALPKNFMQPSREFSEHRHSLGLCTTGLGGAWPPDCQGESATSWPGVGGQSRLRMDSLCAGLHAELRCPFTAPSPASQVPPRPRSEPTPCNWPVMAPVLCLRVTATLLCNLELHNAICLQHDPRPVTDHPEMTVLTWTSDTSLYRMLGVQ